MKAAIVRVSLTALENTLGLSKIDIKIIKVRQTWEEEQAGRFEMLIEGDSLKMVSEGDLIPEVMLEMTTEPHLIKTTVIQ